MTYPAKVELCEVGPRDGFQFEDTFIPTERKADVITQLANAGLPRIQVTSFVHPKWVPQMSDAEDLLEQLPPRPDTVYSGLALNVKGVERAAKTSLTHVDLSIATNETHSKDNANMTVDEGIEQAEEMIELAHGGGLKPQLGFQTVFGYAEPGDTPLEKVLDMARRFADAGLESLSLADTTGFANPEMIKRRVQAVRHVVGDVPVVLHLHDTRGLGLANVVAALEVGVTRFDTAMGGMGGCPFIPGAAGNIATEDTAYLLESLGIQTGVNIDAVGEIAREMELFLDTTYPGKLHALPDASPADQPA